MTQAAATTNPSQYGSRPMRYAVVFKTYMWDAFVERQAARCQAASGAGDFFISIDETNKSVGPVPFDRVVRTSNAEIVAMGFADRFEKGSLLWWNPDYAHYQFQARHPDYDYYVFVEYDVVVQTDIGRLVARMAAEGTDLVHLPFSTAKQDWFWTVYHRQTYPLEELEGSLICLTAFSRQALETLARRRREMAAETSVGFWPNAEVFVPTEIGRAGLQARSLADYGEVAGYSWFPPLLEEDLGTTNGAAFLHPVLDRNRYLASMLKSTPAVRSFFYPRSKLWRALRRFQPREYLPRLVPAAHQRWRTNRREEAERMLLLEKFADPAVTPLRPAWNARLKRPGRGKAGTAWHNAAPSPGRRTVTE